MLTSPNVLIITTDQQRFDGVACNGSHFLHTPNLDKIAEMGINFKRAYCANPVCTPSRVSLMTGQQVCRHGSYNIGTIAENTEDFLSSVLTEHGYRSHHIGKAHFYPWDVESEETKKTDGMLPFRNFAGFQTAELSIGHSDWGVNGHYESWLKEKGIEKGQNREELKVRRLFDQDAYGTGDWGMPKQYHSGAWIVNRVEHFLAQEYDKNPEQPFYLNIGFQDPHHPQVLPKECEKINPESIPKSSGSLDSKLEHLEALSQGRILESRFAGPFGIAGNQNTNWEKETKDTAKMSVIKSYYYSMVELLDEQIGEILALLEQRNLLENTIVVFTSDHGDMLGDHKLGEKGPMAFEEVIRVPFFLMTPDREIRGEREEPVSLVDICPTILDYVGVPISPNTDGISLRRYMETGVLPTRKGVLVEFMEEKDAVRYKCFVTKSWKLVEYSGERFGELYHLDADPDEEHNLYFEPEYLPIKYELTKEIWYRMEQTQKCNQRPCRC